MAAYPWYLIVGALAFSFGVGAISGFMPARRASRLKPVDALRYE
jgi:putative ABC transport system permease protein